MQRDQEGMTSQEHDRDPWGGGNVALLVVGGLGVIVLIALFISIWLGLMAGWK